MKDGDREGEPAEGEDLDIDGEWKDARQAAGLDPDAQGMPVGDPPFLSPYLILYAGFFLGPPAAMGAAMAVAPRALSVRRLAFMVGICGAAWCVIQGATFTLAPSWSELGIQLLRSGLNFAASTTLVLFWWRESPGRFIHNRRIIEYSIIAGLGLLAVFATVPTEFLAYTGR
jgi:hypothetical protein